MSPQTPRSGDGGPRRGGAAAAAAEPGAPAAAPPRAAARRSGAPAAPRRTGGPQRSGGPQRGSSGTTKPSQPTRLPERREPAGRRSTSTTPTACGCRSCSPPPAWAAAASARTSSPPAGWRSTASVVTELGVRIDPDRQVVHVDGIRVQLDESRVYLAFNKPLGVVSTMSDDLGRPSVGDYVAEPQGAALPRRPAGRRHRGPAAAHQRRRPRPPAAAPVVRRAQDLPGRRSPGPVPRDIGKTLRAGIELEDGPVKVDSFKVVDSAARQGAGRDRAARGPQARRTPPARGRRAPGDHAGAHRRRPDPPRRAALGQDAPAHPGRGRAAVRGSRTLSGGASGTARYGDVVSDSIPDTLPPAPTAVRAVRGAIQLEADEREHVLASTRELVTRRARGQRPRPRTTSSRSCSPRRPTCTASSRRWPRASSAWATCR